MLSLDGGRSGARCFERLIVFGGKDDDESDALRPTTDARAAAEPSPRILIVEDEWIVAMEMEAVALSAGYEVVGVAATADEAVAAALGHKPDLVLMDIRLRGHRDGVDAALELRQRADIPCLFVSAHQDPGVRARAQAARPKGWLPKPFSRPQLLAAIKQALGAPDEE